MFRRTLVWGILGTVVAGLGLPSALADSPEESSTRMTVIEVRDMHCNDCAKNIAQGLYGVPGVTAVYTNLEHHKVFVDPQQNLDPSPGAMWEAIESAGFEPIRLAGPFGVFTTNPR